MKTLIIPDIHNRVTWIEDYIRKQKDVDEIVFTGDYFDQFHDTPLDARNTALWLKESLCDPKRVHLLGNHDMPYRFPKADFLWCPGFTPEKCKVINEEITGKLWKKTKFVHFTQGWCLSHAGVHPNVFGHPMRALDEKHILDCCGVALECAEMNIYSQYIASGKRMSNPLQNYGGITWADWNEEFTPVEDINQIVGHTPSGYVKGCHRKRDGKVITRNYCIDTESKGVGWIIDGQFHFEIRK